MGIPQCTATSAAESGKGVAEAVGSSDKIEGLERELSGKVPVSCSEVMMQQPPPSAATKSSAPSSSLGSIGASAAPLSKGGAENVLTEGPVVTHVCEVENVIQAGSVAPSLCAATNSSAHSSSRGSNGA